MYMEVPDRGCSDLVPSTLGLGLGQSPSGRHTPQHTHSLPCPHHECSSHTLAAERERGREGEGGREGVRKFDELECEAA